MKSTKVNIVIQDNDENDLDIGSVVEKARLEAKNDHSIAFDDFRVEKGGKLDVEKLEKYIASHGENSNIEPPPSSANLIRRRQRMKEHEHKWNKWIGTRYSKKRGCFQFWVWIVLGLIVGSLTAAAFASLSLDDVLNLGSFSGEDLGVGQFAFLRIQDEVQFTISYRIESEDNAPFQVLLLDEDQFERWEDGESFQPFLPATTWQTNSVAEVTDIIVENEQEEDFVLVVQSCADPSYCNTTILPTGLGEGQKIYKTYEGSEPPTMRLRSFLIDPDPQSCSESQGYSFLLIFLPWLIVVLFGLRIFHMVFFCRSFRAEIELEYAREANIPEEEVDYWQPSPWDRKVPKTRLLGPCCWKKMRRPTEPFYTWWRHENYFTWIFFPYRNEQLSRMEVRLNAYKLF